MTQKVLKRKLVAILSADVEGYSRLMGDDEEATVRILKSYRVVMGDFMSQYRGRLVDSPGDNILAEFASVVNAVNCAVEIQKVLNARNSELPQNRRMNFRIGVNVGDVIEEEKRIYGDGVNIAARIESLADPGGISISNNAFNHVKNKLKLGYEYIGEHTAKNITDPVKVYKVLMIPKYRGKIICKRRFKWKIKREMIVSAGIILLLFTLGIVIYEIILRLPGVSFVSDQKISTELSKEPSIAVPPIINKGNKPNQGYFQPKAYEYNYHKSFSMPKNDCYRAKYCVYI